MPVEYVQCGHCKGRGKCNCGTCGVDLGENHGDGSPRLREGRCLTCDGSGQVPHYTS